MRAILQRVSQATVTSEGKTLAEQGAGFLILLGITSTDSEEDLNWMVRKVANMRIFEDGEGKMNESIINVEGEVTVVSQFTLFASTKKGKSPFIPRRCQAGPLRTSLPAILRYPLHNARQEGGTRSLWRDDGSQSSQRRSGNHLSRFQEPAIEVIHFLIRTAVPQNMQ